jgi:enterochelin esterase-like enzyme
MPGAILRRARQVIAIGALACLLTAIGVVLAKDSPLPTTAGAASTAVAFGRTSATPVATSVPTVEPTPTPSPTPTATPTRVPTATPSTRPWLASKPTGNGQVKRVDLTAPWSGGGTLDVTIYTPSGYDPKGSRLYPVLYEAPTGFGLWNSAVSVIVEIDAMIVYGSLPPAIVVFIDEGSPPISPSECVDSYGDVQKFETYISSTVVNYVDQNYRTIQDPKARAIMGMSEGGFCAPMLALRHPEIYSVSISFSGYYWAGAAGRSARPYGSQADVDAHSPVLLAPQVQSEVRSRMYFIVVANSAQEFYGPQARNFEAALRAAGYRYLAINSPDGHSWTQVEHETPNALIAWGEQLALTGFWI